MSIADQIFIANCKQILDTGFGDVGQQVRPKWPDGTPAHTLKSFGIVNRYDLQQEFPILTLRKQFLKSAIDEMLWMWQKKSNRLADLNSQIWDAWARPDGTIGKAYGYQLGKCHYYADVDGVMDQVDRMLYDLSHNPASRRIIVNMYNHEDLWDMALAPCAYSVTFNVSGNKLNCLLNQRSQDMLVANGWNVMQYAALTHMVASHVDLEVGELVHVIADAHIYDRHVCIIREIIEQHPQKAPIFAMSRKRFYEFTTDDFRLLGYKSNDTSYNIEVAV